MKGKYILALSTLFLSAVAASPIFGIALEHPLFEQSLPPRMVSGTGTYFEIKDSEYLNVRLTSSEEIKILLESIPKIINLIIEDAADSAVLILEGLEPNKTYYKYQDSYKNLTVFVSDENGNYTWIQDLSKPHHIWFQEQKGTTFIDKDTVLENDIIGSVEITADGVALDCNGYKITGTNAFGKGIYLNGKIRIVIKNCEVSNVSTGISVYYSSEISIENNIISDSYEGVNIARSSDVVLKDNTVLNNDSGLQIGINSYVSNHNTYMGNSIENGDFAGINLYESDNNTLTNNTIKNSQYGIDVYDSDSNVIDGNIISNSFFVGVDFFSGSDNNILVNNIIENGQYGIDIHYSQNNKIYHNNFINNLFQTYIYDSVNNFFNEGYPSGGNYWSDYMGVDEKSGVNQNQDGSDGIGDAPYIFDGGQDKYPFMEPNGWETPIILP